MIEAQGTIWLVEAQGTIWLAEAQGTVCLGEVGSTSARYSLFGRVTTNSWEKPKEYFVWKRCKGQFGWGKCEVRFVLGRGAINSLVGRSANVQEKEKREYSLFGRARRAGDGFVGRNVKYILFWGEVLFQVQGAFHLGVVQETVWLGEAQGAVCLREA